MAQMPNRKPDVMQPLIQPTAVSRMITLFDRVYKLGVEDGCRYAHDEGRCREHIKTTNEPGRFGMIRDGYTSDAVDWQITLQKQAKEMSVYEPVRKMFVRMGKWAASNYYSCILPIAQDFYNKGVEDYLANPNAEEIAPSISFFAMVSRHSRVSFFVRSV